MKVTMTVAEITMIANTINNIGQNVTDTFGNKADAFKPLGKFNPEKAVNSLQDKFNPLAISFTMIDNETIIVDLQVIPGICGILTAYADAVVDITCACMTIYPVVKRALKRYEDSITFFGKFLTKK